MNGTQSTWWINFIDKCTQGDKSMAELLQMWFGSILIGGRPGDDEYRQIRDFLYELDERDPDAASTIFAALSAVKKMHDAVA